jgi:hypothetical protein
MKLKVNTIDVKGDNVKWLIIESDEKDTKGFFLYHYVDESNASDT